MISGSAPTLLVTVSAYSTDVTINKDGMVLYGPEGGEEFWVTGISAGPTGTQLPSPERAVERVGRITGARTADVPELILMGYDPTMYALWVPTHPLWRLSLDRSVRVRTKDGSPRTVQELYVSSNGRLWSPAPAQPAVHHTELYLSGPDPMQLVPAEVPIRSGRPTVFEEVTYEAKGE